MKLVVLGSRPRQNVKLSTWFHVVVEQRRQKNVQKSVMHVQSWFFACLNLLLFCRSRCRRRRRCVNSLLFRVHELLKIANINPQQKNHSFTKEKISSRKHVSTEVLLCHPQDKTLTKTSYHAVS